MHSNASQFQTYARASRLLLVIHKVLEVGMSRMGIWSMIHDRATLLRDHWKARIGGMFVFLALLGSETYGKCTNADRTPVYSSARTA